MPSPIKQFSADEEAVKNAISPVYGANYNSNFLNNDDKSVPLRSLRAPYSPKMSEVGVENRSPRHKMKKIRQNPVFEY